MNLTSQTKKKGFEKKWQCFCNYRFDEVSSNGAACNPTVAPCIGGFARLYKAVMDTYKAEPDSLLLNAGDSFQGTIWYNFYRWNVTQHFMNLLPHDAHVRNYKILHLRNVQP